MDQPNSPQFIRIKPVIRFLGIFLIVFGALFLISGVLLYKTGHFAKNQYEKTPGKILRNFSKIDARAYKKTSILKKTGILLISVSILMVAVGTLMLWQPDQCQRLAGRILPGDFLKSG